MAALVRCPRSLGATRHGWPCAATGAAAFLASSLLAVSLAWAIESQADNLGRPGSQGRTSNRRDTVFLAANKSPEVPRPEPATQPAAALPARTSRAAVPPSTKPDAAGPVAKSETGVPGSAKSGHAGGLKCREGTRVVDQQGTFKLEGQRATFFGAGGRGQYVGLENLNLERIVRAINDGAGQQQWIVTGTVTEYQGVNFLLVEKAVLKDHTEILGDGQ
jgi:hypothetical protein